jgi:hypothetical protein
MLLGKRERAPKNGKNGEIRRAGAIKIRANKVPYIHPSHLHQLLPGESAGSERGTLLNEVIRRRSYLFQILLFLLLFYFYFCFAF